MNEIAKQTRFPEWILTNDSGGYALGTDKLINTRKYHSLLCASNDALWRVNLVNSIEERIPELDAYLDSNDYGDTIYPQGFKLIVASTLRPYPSFLYGIGRDLRIEKSIRMHSRHNITMVSYKNHGKSPVGLALRYKFSLRDHHHVNPPGSFDSVERGESSVELAFKSKNHIDSCHASIRRESVNRSAYIHCLSGKITEAPIVFRNVHYSIEDFRGYDSTEDLISPFIHTLTLYPEREIDILLSDRPIEGRGHFTKIVDEIKNRYSSLPRHFPEKKPFYESEYPVLLQQMMDDFKIRGDIIAGYPWFSCWGRDTMISLEAFSMKNEEDGSESSFIFNVLDGYGREMREGVLPNVKGEKEEGRNYDTVDASLLFANRIFESFHHFGRGEKKNLFGYVARIVLNYAHNPNLPFYMDRDDCLITLKSGSGRAMTWMDVKIDGTPVTPRHGKPIEINALWFNCLMMTEIMMNRLGMTSISDSSHSITVEEVRAMAGKVRKSMASFFHNGVWCDRIEDGRPVEEIRPNFVIAHSLPFDFTDSEGLMRAREIAEEELLTPYGLRSLSMHSPMYIGYYGGSQRERDLAYHQGTVWTWLLLPYAKLIAKTEGDSGKLAEKLEESVSNLKKGILEGIFSSVAEVWDGDNPTVPKGAPAQAWSVAALYCIEKMAGRTTGK